MAASLLSQEVGGALAAHPQMRNLFHCTLEETLAVFSSQVTMVVGIGVVAMAMADHRAGQVKIMRAMSLYLVHRAMQRAMGATGRAARKMPIHPHLITLSLVARAFALVGRLA